MATNKGRRVHHDLWKAPKKGAFQPALCLAILVWLQKRPEWRERWESASDQCGMRISQTTTTNNFNNIYIGTIIHVYVYLHIYIYIYILYTYSYHQQYIYIYIHTYIFIVKHNHVYSLIHDRDPFLTDATKLNAFF